MGRLNIFFHANSMDFRSRRQYKHTLQINATDKRNTTPLPLVYRTDSAVRGHFDGGGCALYIICWFFVGGWLEVQSPGNVKQDRREREREKEIQKIENLCSCEKKNPAQHI